MPKGPWFDGVALLQDKQESTVNVPAAKSKEIAIVGAGRAGLMVWLNLNRAGMKNVTILEAARGWVVASTLHISDPPRIDNTKTWAQ